MLYLRLPVSLVAATFLMLATSSAATVRAESSDIFAINQSASLVGFTIYGSSLFRIKRDGQFKSFTGQLAYDPARPVNTHVDLTVNTNSVDMHNHNDDQLLKSGTFFDVEHFPTMHFSSTSTVVNPDGSFWMTGDMTIRGITKSVTIPVSLRQAEAGNPSGSVFETTFRIDRTEFGLNGVPSWNGIKVSISKSVQIHIAIATALNVPRQTP